MVLLDAEAERLWLDEVTPDWQIRCVAGNWDSADEWLTRAQAFPLTIRGCFDWAAERLGMDAVISVSEPMHARFAQRLLSICTDELEVTARFCIHVLGWDSSVQLNALERWLGFASVMPELPRIVIEDVRPSERADRMAVDGVPIGWRVGTREWHQFLAGNDWSRVGARWRVASRSGGEKETPGSVGAIPSEATRRLVRAVAPEALPRLESAAALILKETSGARGEARSAVEALLFEVLDARPMTKSQFVLNAALDFAFGTRPAEGDLVAQEARLVVEIDGYFHFRDSEDYRRDRRKDAALQQHGWFVLRFLAVDIVSDLEGVLERIDGQLRRLIAPVFLKS